MKPQHQPLLAVDLIPHPLLPGEKGGKRDYLYKLAPLPWERGWGEVFHTEGVG